ncbi:multidrug transporter [Amnibacterium flavum]|uniref:Multidrug transporter n=1 Tax=Amnibacterium flavum TaxID=2173173 RepID=A0A2V1HP37_9MICO|nr:multidrug transporter [Amnibacterium flavum]PVZ94318.1 multidrug transporter [Amnibacterium flavum]
MDDVEFEKNRRDQLTSAPGDKWDDEAAAESIAPRIEVTETESGAKRIDVADTAAVRPGAGDAADEV